MSENHFDVIIIGGRCAGASLARRLGEQGLKILMVDRATFPSLPKVPSSPIIHPGTMQLLDELGVAESDYALPGGRADYYVLNFVNYFEAVMPTTRMESDRKYVYGLDRNVFDHTLWKHAAMLPEVTAFENFAVTEILKDQNGSVTGIVGKNAEKSEEKFTADLIVGADGRFSFAARQFGANVVEEKNEFTTAAYHAEWENVEDYADDCPRAVTLYNTVKGLLLIVLPIDERKYIISTYMRSQDAQFGSKGLEAAYLESVQKVPHLWKRLQNARRVTDVVGVRPIENGYRQAFGANWALVGDALYYKDPIDGQGIYDALIETKILAEAISSWKNDGVAWEVAGAQYQERMLSETHKMFLQTAGRVKQEVHTVPPAFLIKTYIRWMANDPDYQTQFLQYLSRAIDPAEFKTEPSISPKIIWRGIKSDIQKWFSGKKVKEANYQQETV